MVTGCVDDNKHRPSVIGDSPYTLPQPGSASETSADPLSPPRPDTERLRRSIFGRLIGRLARGRWRWAGWWVSGLEVENGLGLVVVDSGQWVENGLARGRW